MQLGEQSRPAEQSPIKAMSQQGTSEPLVTDSPRSPFPKGPHAH